MPLDSATLAPLPPSAREDGAERDSPSYELEFSRNEVRLYEPVPIVFGRHRVVPPLGARTLSEVVNGEVVQKLLVVWGFGPLSVTDLRMSGRPFGEYADISSETREGRAGDAALTLYPGTPITTRQPMAHTAIQVRVTDQLPRRVDEISGIVSAEALDWSTGHDAWIRQATSNPASLMRLALQHPARRRPAGDDDIDLEALQAFHAFCVTNGYEFNGVLETRRSIWDVVTDICAVARARPTLATGRWSVVWDVETADPVEHFCALNMDGFRIERSFEPRPEAVRVRFPNRDKSWRRDERTIYRDGFSASDATEVETVSPYGITDPDHVWKFGSRFLAQQQEGEAWQGQISTENVEIERGARVTVSHETIGAGIASAWVIAVATDSQSRDSDVTLDAPVLFGDGTYQAKFRTDSDADLVAELVGLTAGEATRTVRLRTQDRPAAGTIKVGDLVSFGSAGAVRAEAIVTEIDRRDDLAANVTMVPVRQDVYDAEKGAIPEFVSTLEDISTPLPPLVIDSISSGIAVRRRIGTVVAPRMQVDINPIPVAGARIECQIQGPDADDFGPSALEKAGTTRIVVGDLRAGEQYRFRARWTLHEDNRVGDWTENVHRVEQLRPNPPGSFSIGTDQGGLRRYTFSPPSDDDFAGVRIRYGAVGAEWGSMTALHDGLLTSSPWWSYEPPPGRYSFEIRAVDTDGLESEGVRLDGDVIELGVVRNLGRFHELTAFRKQAVGDPAPLRPTDGSYSFASASFAPPTGWQETWPAHDQDEVVYGVAATAQDQEGDPWQADADDWSDPAIISDAGDINVIYRRGTATGGTVVGTRATYEAPGAPAASAGVPEGWFDDVADVPAGPGLIYVSVGLRRRGQTLFNWGTPEALEGIPGVDGISAAEVPLYQKIGLGAALPSAPATATWDHSTRTAGSIGAWSQDFPSYDPTTERVACTLATGFANDTLSSWSTVRICEAAGDINAVYLRAAEGTTPDRPATGTARVPSGWIDISANLTGEGLAWVSVGHRAYGQANWTWSTPSRISALDGEHGEDGEPGRIGLTGSAGRITRTTRVSARGDANANTEWHMTASTFSGERTINLGNVNDTEKGLIDLILSGGIVTLFHDPDNWADYALDQVSYGTVGGTRQARLRLDYIEHVGDPPAVGDSQGTTIHVHFTPKGEKGDKGDPGDASEDGSAGTSFKELQAFRRQTVGAAAPGNPQDTAESGSHDWGSYNFSTKTFTPPTGWQGTWPGASPGQVVYTIFATADDSTGDPWVPGTNDWTDPIIIDQPNQILGVYQRRANSGSAPGASAGVPSGWYDEVEDVPAGSNPIFVSFGIRARGTTLYTWQVPTKLEGQDGADGINGTIWHRGDTAPGSTLGNNGDFYLRDNGQVYRKSSGAWSLVTNLRGAAGATWFNGTSAPAANLGGIGDYYFRVGSGTTAGTIYRKNDVNGVATWVKQVDIDQGSEGSVWYSDDSPPGANLGNDQNWFLDTDSGFVYEKKSGVWTKQAELYDINYITGSADEATVSLIRSSAVGNLETGLQAWQALNFAWDGTVFDIQSSGVLPISFTLSVTSSRGFLSITPPVIEDVYKTTAGDLRFPGDFPLRTSAANALRYIIVRMGLFIFPVDQHGQSIFASDRIWSPNIGTVFRYPSTRMTANGYLQCLALQPSLIQPYTSAGATFTAPTSAPTAAAPLRSSMPSGSFSGWNSIFSLNSQWNSLLSTTIDVWSPPSNTAALRAKLLVSVGDVSSGLTARLSEWSVKYQTWVER